MSNVECLGFISAIKGEDCVKETVNRQPKKWVNTHLIDLPRRSKKWIVSNAIKNGKLLQGYHNAEPLGYFCVTIPLDEDTKQFRKILKYLKRHYASYFTDDTCFGSVKLKINGFTDYIRVLTVKLMIDDLSTYDESYPLGQTVETAEFRFNLDVESIKSLIDVILINTYTF